MNDINPDDDLGLCAAIDCLESAGVMATVELHPHGETGAASEDDPIVLAVPVCVLKHAHLLRMQPNLGAVNSGV